MDYNEYEIPWMTAKDATQILRGLGMEISPESMRGCIKNGTFPFGDVIAGEGKKGEVKIYTKMLDAWIQERAVKK